MSELDRYHDDKRKHPFSLSSHSSAAIDELEDALEREKDLSADAIRNLNDADAEIERLRGQCVRWEAMYEGMMAERDGLTDDVERLRGLHRAILMQSTVEVCPYCDKAFKCQTTNLALRYVVSEDDNGEWACPPEKRNA